MKTYTNLTGTVITVTVALLMVGAVPVAEAGRGGSAARIKNAIATGSTDAIVAEVERAERLICAACIEPVMGLLDSEDERLREVAAWWFSRRPAQKKELEELASAMLVADDSIQVRNAADILGTFRHPKAIPALSAAAQRTDVSAEARAHAVRALGTIGHPDANAALSAAMSDADAAVRLAAVSSWLDIRRQQGAEPMAALVSDSSTEVRRKAAAVLGNLRESAGREALEAQLAADPDPAVRRNAAWALGRIGDAASRAALEAAADDESSLVRRTAKAAVQQLK